MKNLSLICFLIIAVCIKSFSQSVYIPINIVGKVTAKLDKSLLVGDGFSSLIYSCELKELKEEKTVIVTKVDGVKTIVKYSDLLLNSIIVNKSESQYWSYMAFTSGVYSSIMDKGFQFDIRYELEQESLDYLRFLEESNMIINDDVIHDYLQSVLLKIYPIPLNDGRTSQINIKILKNNEPYAAILPNGIALISIGLLTMINSEEELIAVLAHETAHFVLDHAVKNINQEIKQLKRAEFWAGLSAVAVAATTTYLSVKNDVYLDPIVNNNLILNAASLAYSLSSEISERIGLKYSRVQEFQADNCATNILKNLGYDSKALASVLSKIKDYYQLTGNYKVFSDNGTHPSIIYRIEKIGFPTQEFKSKLYDSRISFLLSMDAYFEYKQSHFKTCDALLLRLIDAGIATEADYILKAMVNLSQYNTDDKYQESLNFLNKAKSLGVNPEYQIAKYESIIHLRKNDISSAQKSLKEYKSELEKKIATFNLNLLVASEWNNHYNLLNEELDWTKKMIYKTVN